MTSVPLLFSMHRTQPSLMAFVCSFIFQVLSEHPGPASDKEGSVVVLRRSLSQGEGGNHKVCPKRFRQRRGQRSSWVQGRARQGWRNGGSSGGVISGAEMEQILAEVMSGPYLGDVGKVTLLHCDVVTHAGT